MRERPILFSAPMVRALLAGQKTQTRRVVKPAGAVRVFQFRGTTAAQGSDEPTGKWAWCGSESVVSKHIRCPYGMPGDRLWVKETWAAGKCADGLAPSMLHPGTWLQDNGGLWYPDSDTEPAHPISPRGKTRVSIHMPRWASRILLEVTDVRVERLQAISETDAQAEGVHGPEDDVANNLPNCPQCGGVGLYTAFNPATGGALPDADCERCDTPKKRFRLLWESINGAEPWEANPWVWCVSFRRVLP